MVVGVCQLCLTAEWVRSLKEKRAEVKSIVTKTQHKFNVSIAEVEAQDIWQSIVLGFACVSNDTRHAENMIRQVMRYITSGTDAVVTDEKIEILHVTDM